MREGDDYLRLLKIDDEAAEFAAHWEAVAAEVEGRPIRENLHRGPMQQPNKPMSNAEFSALFKRVQQRLASSKEY